PHVRRFVDGRDQFLVRQRLPTHERGDHEQEDLLVLAVVPAELCERRRAPTLSRCGSYFVILNVLRQALVKLAFIGVERIGFYGNVVLNLADDVPAIRRRGVERLGASVALHDPEFRLFSYLPRLRRLSYFLEPMYVSSASTCRKASQRRQLRTGPSL